ncbi:formate dehydrogenase accessory sulfurtransferase FdhD [Thermoplasma sp.]|uniref:formate dehydrogenase accessory sulfurtransferase FdhD n=1 Tax=Thermoplasma sp. TaxID=1973142 RepID=UPI0026394C17|nr:formate dehydrogenase accessory sulfurtransferase FdhD [Thermoplasma sp.]
MEVSEHISGKTRREIITFRQETGFIKTMDDIAVEEPLAIDIEELNDDSERVGVIMRTPIMDGYLAIGFLYSEGFLSGPADIDGIDGLESDGVSRRNQITVRLRRKIGFRVQTRFINSACGVCGRSTIADLLMRHGKIIDDAQIDLPTILSLPAKMGDAQSLFMTTGGVHAAALFDTDGYLKIICEDIGRHNAVDKVIGYKVIENLDMDAGILMVSGRAGFEIVEKAFIAGFPIVASVSAPSSLAVQVAESMGITLVCFLRNNKFNVYSHPERILP